MKSESWAKISPSYTFESTGSIDVGRKSFSNLNWFSLEIAQMRASFEADGKYKFLMPVLMTSVGGDPK